MAVERCRWHLRVIEIHLRKIHRPISDRAPSCGKRIQNSYLIDHTSEFIPHRSEFIPHRSYLINHTSETKTKGKIPSIIFDALKHKILTTQQNAYQLSIPHRRWAFKPIRRARLRFESQLVVSPYAGKKSGGDHTSSHGIS